MSVLSFFKFFNTGLCNSSAKYWSIIISLLTAPPANLFLRVVGEANQNIYKPLKQHPFDIQWYSRLSAILNILSGNALSEAVLLGKSLRSPLAISC